MKARRGRRPGRSKVTRDTILDAARAAFAARGYERATIRSIAAAAAVDPALVHHHFGTKQDLFVAAHGLPFSPSATIDRLFDDSEGGTLGERLARFYLTAAFVDGESLEALVRAAVSNTMARDMLRGFFQDEVLDRIARRLGTPDARLRVALVGSQLIGLFMMRRILELDAIKTAEIEVLVKSVAPTLDRYLTGDVAQLG